MRSPRRYRLTAEFAADPHSYNLVKLFFDLFLKELEKKDVLIPDFLAIERLDKEGK